MLNYTTSVPVSRTLAQMQSVLAKHGATAIATRYTDKEPSAISFTVETPHGERAFTLPVDVTAVHKVLIKQLGAGRKGSSAEQAARVAWRIIKDWLEAQLALIEAQMATLDQVMLPYMHVRGELTMYEAFRENEQRSIGGDHEYSA